MATLSEDTHPLLAEAFAVWTDKGGGKGGHDTYSLRSGGLLRSHTANCQVNGAPGPSPLGTGDGT
jgi:hypothetical protein